MRKVLAIVGPTASGKTSFGIKCAKEFNGEIISGDSIQIYKGLDIGSAKASKGEQEEAIHHLIDIKEANDNYSVKEFQDLGRKLIEDISNRNKLPIVVGGTGLYIKSLLYDYEFNEEDGLDNQYEDLSNEEIYSLLKEKDPRSLEKIHVNNRKRLIRALNYFEKHGYGIQNNKDNQKHDLIYDAKIIGLTMDKEALYDRVNQRVDIMIKDGLIDEIKCLLDKGITFEDQSMQAIGYKEFKNYFEGTSDLETCIDEVKKNTRHFVKRQYTWFNNQMKIEWFSNLDDAFKSIEDWYE